MHFLVCIHQCQILNEGTVIEQNYLYEKKPHFTPVQYHHVLQSGLVRYCHEMLKDHTSLFHLYKISPYTI